MKKLFFLLLTVFMLACSGGDTLPKGILAKNKMQAVIWDMIRAGEYLDGYVFIKDTTGMDRNAKALEWYDNIYRLHQITRADFEKSYAYYRDHPPLMKEILDSLSTKPVSPVPVTPTPASPDSLSHIDTRNRKRILQPAGNNRLQLLADSVKKSRRALKRAKLQ